MTDATAADRCPSCGALRSVEAPRFDPWPIGSGVAAALVTLAVVWLLTKSWELALVYPTAFGFGVVSLVSNDRALRRSRAAVPCPSCGTGSTARTSVTAD